MAYIKKLKDKYVGGNTEETVFPVTLTQAVYASAEESLDSLLSRKFLEYDKHGIVIDESEVFLDIVGLSVTSIVDETNAINFFYAQQESGRGIEIGSYHDLWNILNNEKYISIDKPVYIVGRSSSVKSTKVLINVKIDNLKSLSFKLSTIYDGRVIRLNLAFKQEGNIYNIENVVYTNIEINELKNTTDTIDKKLQRTKGVYIINYQELSSIETAKKVYNDLTNSLESGEPYIVMIYGTSGENINVYNPIIFRKYQGSLYLAVVNYNDNTNALLLGYFMINSDGTYTPISNTLSLDDIVSLSKEQTITGVKTFTSTPAFNSGANFNNSNIKNVGTPQEDKDAANKSYVDSNFQSFYEDLLPELSKIGDPKWKGIKCLTLGNSMSEIEFNNIVTTLQDILNNQNHYSISIFDTVDNTFLGDCELIQNTSNIITIDQVKISGNSIYKILYKFNLNTNSYSRTWSSVNLDDKQNIISDLDTIRNNSTKGAIALSSLSNYQHKLTAGTGIDITDNKISCTLDPTIFVIVESLPSTPSSENINKIHLVKDTTVEGNLYSEYLWANNAWEKLGDFQPTIDLSDYATKVELNAEAQLRENNDVAISPSEPVAKNPIWVDTDDSDEEVIYNKEQVDKIAESKQDKLTLTVKDNGNIVLANIQGQSKEFMPATPSGDPMHYAYVVADAEYNDTGADIVKDAPWADMIDDDYDGPYGKTVVHKAGYWYLNGLGDITNDEMNKIFVRGNVNFMVGNTLSAWKNDKIINIRTNLNYNGGSQELINGARITQGNTYLNIALLTNNTNINKALITKFIGGDFAYIYQYHILGVFYAKTANFIKAINLISLKLIALDESAIFKDSPNLSIKSVLFMINEEAATSPITITLHANAYNRCMANADILAALQAHTNVSLASA